MELSIDSLHTSIVENMVDHVQDGWVEASLHVKRADADALALSGGYKMKDGEFISFRFRDFDRRIIEDFHSLYRVMAQQGQVWNRLDFTLYPSGQLSIDSRLAS